MSMSKPTSRQPKMSFLALSLTFPQSEQETMLPMVARILFFGLGSPFLKIRVMREVCVTRP
jgi:hypothetical protein